MSVAPLSLGDFIFTALTFIILLAVIGGFVALMVFLIKRNRRH